MTDWPCVSDPKSNHCTTPRAFSDNAHLAGRTVQRHSCRREVVRRLCARFSPATRGTSRVKVAEARPCLPDRLVPPTPLPKCHNRRCTRGPATERERTHGSSRGDIAAFARPTPMTATARPSSRSPLPARQTMIISSSGRRSPFTTPAAHLLARRRPRPRRCQSPRRDR